MIDEAGKDHPLRPEVDTLNRPVRSLLTPPERRSFKPYRLGVPSNQLDYAVLSRKRPWRLTENVEWCGTAASRPSPQNHL
jgi:hypothetical protein